MFTLPHDLSLRIIPRCGRTLTLVSEFKPRPVLRVVTVEVDERLVSGAQQSAGQVRAAELPDHRAGVIRAVLNFKVIMISFGRKIQKLNMCTYEKNRQQW